MSIPAEAKIERLADLLWHADTRREPCPPVRDEAARLDLEPSAETAYAVQRVLRARRTGAGDRVIGKKIGLTAKSVQKQLGVDRPDYGSLWQSTAYGDGDTVGLERYIKPRIEAEVAIVLGRDIDTPHPTLAELISATAYALPALEIVDSRIAGWDIKLFDTVCDNASAGGLVLGADPRPLGVLSLRAARMQLARNGCSVSEGSGRECMGHPLNAALWLARQLAELGDPLRAGDVVLTGALGPMVAIDRGDRFEACIEGLGGVAVDFA